MKNRPINYKRFVMISLFTSFAIILGYVEFLIPVNIGIYGFKLGLSNIATVIVLCSMGFIPALFVLVVRIVTVNLLFGSIFSLIFSLAAGLCSLLVMWILKKVFKCHPIFFSGIGGVTHNIVQLIVASVLLGSTAIMYLFPPLLVLGVITGVLVGYIAKLVLNRIEKYIPR